MPIWTAIHGFRNGDQLEEHVMNMPLSEIRERTDYLYNRVTGIAGANPFEAIRVQLPVATGESAPAVKDVVYLNPVTHVLEKAVAQGALVDAMGVADARSFAAGILVALADGVGTVVLGGRLVLADDSGAWAATDLLQPGESFRPGPFFVSSTTPGKLTAVPRGPSIFIGTFLSTVADGTLLDYALIQPQYKDVAEAHRHDLFVLKTQPAGTQTYDPDPFTGTHTVNGFAPTSSADTVDGTHTGSMGVGVLTDAAATLTASNLIGVTITNITKATSAVITANTATTVTAPGVIWDTGDQYKIAARCRLVIKGQLTGTAAVQYTLLLTASDGVSIPVSGTTGFEDVWLKWTSSDLSEGTGLSQIRSYELPVGFGTKGLTASLENGTVNYSAIESCGYKRREWIVNAPAQVEGWLAVKQRIGAPQLPGGTARGYSFRLYGRHTSANLRISDTIGVTPAHIYRIVYGVNMPVDGDTVTVAGIVFEFDDNGVLTSPDNIGVQIIATDPTASFSELLYAIVERAIPGCTPVQDDAAGHLLIGVRDADAVTASFTSLSITLTEILIAGPWSLSATNGFLVYDSLYKNLVVGDTYASGVRYWTGVALTNGLTLMPIPYGTDGTPASSAVVGNGDRWVAVVSDPVPGAKFVYNVGINQSLAQVYPPVPLSGGGLTLNGVEMNQSVGAAVEFKFAVDGIYWLSDKFGAVPWPATWQSITIPGPAEQQQTLLYRGVHLTYGTAAFVTSIQPAPGAPIRFNRCGTAEAATSGDLMADLDLSLGEVDSGLEGFQVYKGVNGSKLLKGPVVSQIEAGPGIEIVSQVGAPNGRGRVRISATSGSGLTGNFEVALANAKEELCGLFSYIKLLEWNAGSTNINTGFILSFRVPMNVTSTFKVGIYLTMFGLAGVVKPTGITPQIKYAGLDITTAVLHDFRNIGGLNVTDNLITGLITSAAPRRVNVPIGDVTADPIYNAYDPFIISNVAADPINEAVRLTPALGDLIPTVDDIYNGAVIDPSQAYVTGGSLVAIKITRASASNPATEYTGALGFLAKDWKLM